LEWGARGGTKEGREILVLPSNPSLASASVAISMMSVELVRGWVEAGMKKRPSKHYWLGIKG